MTVPIATKFGRMVTYLERLNHKVIQRPEHVVLQSHVTNENHYISTTTVPMATKLGKMVPDIDGLLLIKSHNPLIT